MGDVGGDVFLKAGLHFLPIVVTLVGDHIHLVDPQGSLGPPRHAAQKAKVGDVGSHLVIDDQFVLAVDAELHVVADDRGFPTPDRHGTAIRVRQGDLRLPALLHLFLELSQLGLPPLHGLDLLPQLVGVRLVWQILFPFIRLVQLLQVLVDLLLQLLHLPLELALGEVTPLGVLGFELAAVNGHQLSPKQIELAAEEDELPTDATNCSAVVPAEVGDGLACPG